MSFQSYVTERLLAISEALNQINLRAKKIDDLPVQSTLDPSSKIQVSRNGESESLQIQKIIESVQVGTYNRLLSIEKITLDVNVVTIPALAQWVYDNVNYSNPAIINITVPYCATGLSRKDILVANTLNDIVLVQGPETAGITIQPNLPPNTVYVTEMDVTDSTVGQPQPPEVNGAYVQKSERANVYLTGSGIINMLELTDEKATIVFKGSVTRLNTISYASVPYNGKRITLFNAQNTPVTIGNSVSGFGVDFVFPDGQDYILKPNETIEFSFDITYFPYAHHMLIGASPDLSNKADLVGGFVPQSQLPSYVDDILEFPTLANFPATGEAGKIYIAISPKNLQYRWSGSAYVAVTNGFIANTDDVPEGNNKYSTENRVLNYFLTGLSTLTNSSILNTDSIVTAFGKLQAQINALLTGKKNKTLAITTEPAITKTLAATDECIVFTNANPVAFTIPTNASVPIPIGTEVQYTQQGDGVVTVGGAGITFVTNLALAMVKGETRTLTKIGTDTWTVEGNIPKEVIMPYCVYVDFVNGSDANGKIEDKTKPFKNIDNALSSLPIENGKAWKLVFLSAGNYPCTSLPNRNLEFDSDYLVDIDFTSSALSYVAFGVAKFYRFYGGKISIKSQKVTFQQFAQGNVSVNGVSIEGHINEIKWESPSSSGIRSLIHIDNFRGTILKINKVNTYATNVAGAVFSFTTVNGDYSFLEVLEYSSNISLALIKRISTTGPLFNNVLIGNITGTANCVFGDVDTIQINKASGTGTITFSVNKLIFNNTSSTNNFNFGGVGIVTGNLISTNYNAANSSPAALFLNFQGKLNDLRHYGAVSARFVNCVIESNTVLFTNFDTTNLDGRLIFENCILKQVSASEIVKGTASTVHIFGTVKTNQTLSSTLTIINKTPNTY